MRLLAYEDVPRMLVDALTVCSPVASLLLSRRHARGVTVQDAAAELEEIDGLVKKLFSEKAWLTRLPVSILI